MIWFISTFIFVIAVTIVYIARTYAWLAEQRLMRSMDFGPLIVERYEHKVETLVQRFMYTSMLDFDHMAMRGYMMDNREPNNHIVSNNKHLEAIKRDYAYKLAKLMLETGLVEVQSRKDHYSAHPHCNHVQMTVKVIRPEPENITYYGRI